MKKIVQTAISFLLIALLVISVSPMKAFATESKPDSLIVVSLGDSYSSGEGIEPFYGQEKDIISSFATTNKLYDKDWLAHRSKKSWAALLEFPGIDGKTGEYKANGFTVGEKYNETSVCKWYFVAASGATTKNITSEKQSKNYKKYYATVGNQIYTGIQAKRLPSVVATLQCKENKEELPRQLDVFDGIGDSVDYVTLTIGGNDIGFSDIVTDCALGSSYLHVNINRFNGISSIGDVFSVTLKDRIDEIKSNFDNTKKDLEDTYLAIQQKAPNSKILVAGYPHLFEPTGKGFLISKNEATEVNNAVDYFNREIEGLISKLHREGANGAPVNIYFVPVVSEFSGHEAYSPKDSNGKEMAWINPITTKIQTEDLDESAMASDYSMHPNEEGAKAYARCVNNKIAEIESTNQKGQISGKVCQASDRETPIYGATVTFYREMLEAPLPSEMLPYYAEKSVKTDQNGNYSTDLPIGNYQVEISASGYIGFNSYTQVLKDQNSYMETFLMVEGDPSSKGIAEGTISNALTGSGVSDVNLTVRKDWNNNNQGDVVAMSKTDTNGHYSVELPLGNYTVTAEKDGHVTTSFNIIVQQGTTSNQNGVITPLLSGEDFRIVLTWGESPSDLDSHVRGIKSNGDDFHVYYEHDSDYDGDIEICNLDVDDTDSYGPETITLHATESSPYYYYIHRYSSSGTLGASEAKIEVYQGENLIATYNVPTNMENYEYWNVFAIKDGQLIVKNTITDEPDITYEKDNVYKTVYSISKDEIESTKNLNMVEWHPLEGLTSTMLGFSTDETVIDISPEGTWTKNGNLVSKPMEIVDNSGTVLDAAGFVMNWISNAQEITQLKVSTGKNNTIQIDYGSSFELGHSGKKITLGELLVDKYYSYSPSIVFTYSEKADECIRNWFGFTGDGKYYMDLEFGKVYVGDFGYRLVVEDNELYQVPIIHEDSSYKVYYKEKGKDPVFVLDAADVLRCTRIKLSEDEKNKVLNQLSENGFEINIK